MQSSVLRIQRLDAFTLLNLGSSTKSLVTWMIAYHTWSMYTQSECSLRVISAREVCVKKKPGKKSREKKPGKKTDALIFSLLLRFLLLPFPNTPRSFIAQYAREKVCPHIPLAIFTRWYTHFCRCDVTSVDGRLKCVHKACLRYWGAPVFTQHVSHFGQFTC